MGRETDAQPVACIAEIEALGLPAKHGYTRTAPVLADLLGISLAEARARVRLAAQLAPHQHISGEVTAPLYPATAAAPESGDISDDHAKAVHRVMHAIPSGVGSEAITDAKEIFAALAATGTPESVAVAGQRLLAYLDPDGSVTDDTDRARMPTLTIGRQGSDAMASISGRLGPETVVVLTSLPDAWAAPGCNNPDDPESPWEREAPPYLRRAMPRRVVICEPRLNDDTTHYAC